LAFSYYSKNIEDGLKEKLFCTYVAKKNTIDCCGKEARYILLGEPEERKISTIGEDIYSKILEKYTDDPKQSFGKFRCSACKGKALKDSISKCEELVGGQEKNDTDHAREQASSPVAGRRSSTRKTTPTKILNSKGENYTDKLISLEDGTGIVTRKIKGKRSPVIIGKLDGDNHENYIDNLVEPTEEEITKSGLNYEKVVIEEKADEEENDNVGTDDEEVNQLVENLA